MTGVTEFHVHVLYFAGGAADQFRGRAVVIDPQAILPPAPVDTGVAPRYQTHTPTQDQLAAGMTRNSSDEPTIAYNPKTGNVMF